MKSRTFYINRNNTPRVFPLEEVLGETLSVRMDWNAYLGPQSATISASAWTVENSGVIGSSGAASSSGVTSVNCAASNTGCSMLKNTVTLSTGEILVRKFRVKVIDPQTSHLDGYSIE